jgi:hypothetical protein
MRLSRADRTTGTGRLRSVFFLPVDCENAPLIQVNSRNGTDGKLVLVMQRNRAPAAQPSEIVS